MKPFQRSDRVSGLIRKTLSQTFLKEIKDPRLESVMITGVKVSADLKLARVYFINLGRNTDKEPVIQGLEKARGFIKRTLARQLDLRYMPDLKFFYDDSFDYGDRIEKILKKLNVDDGSDHTSVEK